MDKVKQRYDWVDVAKALGIILVVVAHAMTKDTYLWNVIQQFHMPLFFVLSGFFFKAHENKNTKQYIIGKIKRLWIPYFIVNVAYCFIDFTSLQTFLKELIKTIFMLENKGVFGATWFLQVLFYLSILNYSIDKLLKNEKTQKGGWLLLLIISILLGRFTSISHHISTTFTAEAFYLIGYFIKKSEVHIKLRKLSMNKKVILSMISLVILLSISTINKVSFSKNNYEYFGLFIISSLSGIYLVYHISCILEKNRFLQFIGKHTLEILIWQFVAFKMVIALQIMYYSLDFSAIKAYPYYRNDGIWFVLLCIAGIGLPILGAIIINKIKFYTNKNIHKVIENYNKNKGEIEL